MRFLFGGQRDRSLSCLEAGGVLPWIMWYPCVLFTLFQFILQLTSGEMVQGLMVSFSLTPFRAGLLCSVYYYIYAALQMPAGGLLDRFGPRRLLAGGALLCGVSCAVFAASTVLFWAYVGRLFLGMGASFAFVGTLCVISRSFAADRFAKMTALTETVGMLGILVMGVVMTVWIERLGWRACMWVAAVLGILLSVLLWVCVSDQCLVQESGGTREGASSRPGIAGCLRHLLRQEGVYANALYAGVMFAMITVFVSLWGIPFLQASHGVSLTQATVICNMAFLGIAMGSPFWGWLDHVRPHWRRIIMVLAPCFIALILESVLLFFHLSLVTLYLALWGVGFFCSVYILTFVVAAERSDLSNRSLSIGFVNMVSVATAPILQPLIGYLIGYVMLLHHHISVAAIDYQQGLLVLPLFLLVAVLLAYRVPASPWDLGESEVAPKNNGLAQESRG